MLNTQADLDRIRFQGALRKAWSPAAYAALGVMADHVFALMHLLGFRFAPRIRDLGDTKLYIPKGDAA